MIEGFPRWGVEVEFYAFIGPNQLQRMQLYKPSGRNRTEPTSYPGQSGRFGGHIRKPGYEVGTEPVWVNV
jgi:hypothetical protein